jgi:gas vesicle protein
MKIIKAFIFGFILGGAVSLFLAPQSGEETRAIVLDKGIELRDKAIDLFDDVKVKGKEALDKINSK